MSLYAEMRNNSIKYIIYLIKLQCMYVYLKSLIYYFLIILHIKCVYVSYAYNLRAFLLLVLYIH